VTWLLTALVAIGWLQVEGLAWFDRRYPGARARITARAPLGRAAMVPARSG
jgi:hypothetical protein